MSDRMTPIPVAGLLDWILSEQEKHGTIFGVNKLYYAPQGNEAWRMFGERMELPMGPAAGPHTQLAHNIAAAYAAGAQFFELKTVQVLDGEDLPVAKPCILAEDEAYNVEWSTELTVPQALDEYIKAWFLCKLLAREYGLGDPDGFVFNMSVGYDYEGIRSPKIDRFIDTMRDAGSTAVWRECKQAAHAALGRFAKVDAAYIDAISPKVCGSITLSTLHGCPPEEIERIATYLIQDKGIHTFIKCNPTLLGYDYTRQSLDDMGFGYLSFDEHHFQNDLQYGDAIPMLRRLQQRADDAGVQFGVKLTNTFPVQITGDELPGEQMYLSGQPLYLLTISLAEKLAQEFGGRLRMSFSGGADAFNTAQLVQAGIWPVTIATTLLKPGGYNRLEQIARQLGALAADGWSAVDAAAVQALRQSAFEGKEYRKRRTVKPAKFRKIARKVPLTDCFTAPCSHGCPICQDIPAYVGLVNEGRYLEALEVIVEKNPLPFITGTICFHRCTDKCTRNYYEEPVDIRGAKLVAAQHAMDELMEKTVPMEMTGARTAVIGGGPAGLAAAYFLARNGVPVTVFEQQEKLGGIVRYGISRKRISDEAIDRDIALIEKVGVNFVTGLPAPTIDQLKTQGYIHIVVAVGANRSKQQQEDGGYLAAQGLTPDGQRAALDDNLMSSIPNVYVAGDAHHGPASVVEAIADASRVAQAICADSEHRAFDYASGGAAQKKGVLARRQDAACEGERCLECDVLCECCVDACPNRANVAVLVNGKPQILHLDKLCNECGNCEAFCPYDSAPYKDKFTLFATQAEFEESGNDGFLMLDGKARVRLCGKVHDAGDTASIPPELRALMDAVCENYAYLI